MWSNPGISSGERAVQAHQRGAFTGAVRDKIGKFEAANHGTIFLDEIGTMPLHLQSKLLRVLQEQEIERVGGTKPIKLDVRVVSATNADLEDQVKQESFGRRSVLPAECNTS